MLFTHKMQIEITFSKSLKPPKIVCIESWTFFFGKKKKKLGILSFLKATSTSWFFLVLLSSFYASTSTFFMSRKFNLEKRGIGAASSGGKFENTANFSNRKMTSSSFLPRRNELFSYFVWMLQMTFSFLVKQYFDPEVGVQFIPYSTLDWRILIWFLCLNDDLPNSR